VQCSRASCQCIGTSFPPRRDASPLGICFPLKPRIPKPGPHRSQRRRHGRLSRPRPGDRGHRWQVHRRMPFPVAVAAAFAMRGVCARDAIRVYAQALPELRSGSVDLTAGQWLHFGSTRFTTRLKRGEFSARLGVRNDDTSTQPIISVVSGHSSETGCGRWTRNHRDPRYMGSTHQRVQVVRSTNSSDHYFLPFISLFVLLQFMAILVFQVMTSPPRQCGSLFHPPTRLGAWWSTLTDRSQC